MQIASARPVALSALLALILPLFQPTVAHAQPGAAAPRPGEVAGGPVQPPPPPSSGQLAAAISQYNSQPDNASFERVMASLGELLMHPTFSKADTISILKANPGLSELGLRVISFSGSRIWTFPRVAHAQSILLSWQHTTSTAVGAGRRKTVVHSVSPRAQFLCLPQGITLSDARLVSRAVQLPPAKKGHKPVVVQGPRNLVLTGNERATGLIWLKALKPSDGNWYDTPEMLSSIPPFLLQNVQGKASFSGSDLVLNIAAQHQESVPTKNNRVQSGSYRIVLKLVNGHYVMEGKAPDEGPFAVANQFAQAIQDGRQDMAKAWLTDGKLAAIPGYLGLYGKSDKPFRVIAMANPLSGGSRFRIITFGKDDLIIDIGLVKRWEGGKARTFHAVKGVFIAPPDPFAQRLLGVAPAAQLPIQYSAESPQSSTGTPSLERIGNPPDKQ